MNILIAEDEVNLLRVLKFNFETEGYNTFTFSNGLEALNFFKENKDIIDLAVLDVMMPGLDGYKVCEGIKKERDIPVLILTAKSSTQDLVDSFDSGADDYISKPYILKELMVRVLYLLSKFSNTDTLEFANVKIDLDGRKVFVSNKEIVFSKKEYNLLLLLLNNRGNVVNKEDILKAIWGTKSTTSRSVDTHIKNIRKKLGDAGSNIKTVHGVGYRFD